MFNLYSYMKEYERKMDDINRNGWRYHQQQMRKKPLYCRLPYFHQSLKCQCDSEIM
jgi:hypothetical protein